MKAQARKILALIMAMVMCLSLAAPAFAAEEAVEDTSAEASVVETVETEEKEEEEKVEAPETEEKEEEEKVEAQEAEEDKDKLDVQALPSAVTNVDLSGDKKNIEVYENNVLIESIALKDIGDKKVGQYVTVEKASTVVGLVAEKTTTRYVVTANKGFGEYSENVDVESEEATKLSDIAADKWVALTDTNNWFESPVTQGRYVKVSGSYYLEKQTAANTYKVYFKLAQYDDEKDVFNPITDKKVVWAVFNNTMDNSMPRRDTVTLTSETLSDAQVRGILKNAKACNAVGGDRATRGLAYNGGAAKMIDSIDSADRAYTYTVLPNSVNGATITSAGAVTVNGVSSGSFKVDVTYTATVEGQTVTKKEIDPNAVKNALAKVAGNDAFTLTVSGPDANQYFEVTATKKNDGAGVNTVYTGTAEKQGNTAQYDTNKVVLIDTTKTGSYDNGTKTVPKDYKLAGPVAIAKSVIDANQYVTYTGADVDGYYYFANVDAMKAALTYSWCKADATVQYVQLNITGEESNKGVTYTEATNTVTVNDKWATTAGADIATRTATLDAANHKLFESTDTVPATCLKKGSVTKKISCGVCGTVISSETKETAILEDALVLGSEANHYQLTAAELAEYRRTHNNQDPAHYIESYKTDSTNENKLNEGEVVTTFICNHGEVRSELTKKTKVEKTALQPTGKWDYVEWGTQNAANVRDYSKLFGWSPSVDDTDVDYNTVPVKNAFTWAVASPSDLKYDSKSGCYYNGQKKDVDHVYAKDAAGKTVDKGAAHYAAVLLVKDIKNGEKDCVDGSATIEINVYKVNDGVLGAQDNYTKLLPGDVAETIKNKQAELVNTFTKAVVIPAEKTHVDANNDGKCDNCGNDINQTTPVNENTVDISTATVKFDDLTYTGKAAQPTVTVTLDGVKLAKGIDYEVEEMQAVNAGTYPLIVKGKGDFSGRVVGKVKINKATGKITASADKIQAKKNKAVKAKMSIKVTGGSVKAVKAKGVSGVKVSKTGVITVPKKCKGGTLKVTVSMKAKKNYKAAKAVTVKVKIKKAK